MEEDAMTTRTSNGRVAAKADGTARGALTIVLVGTVLGVGFNWLGLDSRADWGLSWIGVDRVASMPLLEDLAGDEQGPEPFSGYTEITDPMAVGGGGDLPQIPDLPRPIQMQLAAVKQLFDAGAVLLIDAREPEEYTQGHIPGALSMPYDEVSSEPERLEKLAAGGKAIAVYCGGGACELSLNLAWDLISAGQKKVVVYMGGYPEWVAAGYPIDQGS